MPTLFDAANPHVLKGQPHPTDDEPRRAQRRQRLPTPECLVAKAAGTRQTTSNATPITLSAGMILLFLHRLAGRSRRPGVVNGILRALHGHPAAKDYSAAVNGGKKASTPTAVGEFESGYVWTGRSLADGTPISNDPNDWTNITPGLAIKPLGPGCGKGNTGLPDNTPPGSPGCVP